MINSWPGRVLLKIGIVDVDGHHEDDVDFLQTVLSLEPTKGRNRFKLTLKNRVQLDIEAHLYCGQNYYGLTCAEHCVPRDDDMGHYTCNTQTGSKICLTGWVGSECNTSEDNCIVNKCQNGGLCKDLINRHGCVCPAGFTGNLCEQDVNECANHDMCGHGLCVNLPGSYICKCFPGKVCDEDIDECQLSPCSNNGTCVNYTGGHRCDCLSGYHGNDCSLDVDECNHSPCKNEGVCTHFLGGYSCQCPAGFEGFHCDSDIDECENSNLTCHNGGSCINTPGNYTCQCVKGFEGQNCETNVNECLSGPCKHNATCHDLIGSYSCDSTQGYTDISIPFYLACTIEPSMEWTVIKGLQQIFLDSHLFEGKELTVSYRSQAETFKDGQTATSIYPTVTANGEQLSDQEISFVLNKESQKVQDYLHCPLLLDAAQQNVTFTSAHMLTPLEINILENKQEAMKKHIERSCQTLGLETNLTKLSREMLMRSRILVNDKHKLLYCQVGQVASKKLRRIILAQSDKVNTSNMMETPANDADHKYGEYITDLSDLPHDQIVYRIQNYYKFVFVREPFGRLLSAFRNKFERQTNASRYFQKRVGRKIIKRYRQYSPSVNSKADIKFDEFVMYLIDAKRSIPMNKHWEKFTELCHPCMISYDFIGKLESINTDAKYILMKNSLAEKVKIPGRRGSPDGNYKANSLLSRYYSLLPRDMLRKLFTAYISDFTIFQYSIPDVIKYLM